MSHINSVEMETITKTDEVINRIKAVADKATPADKAKHTEMIGRSNVPGAEVIQMTPPMAAMIFLENNKRNRDWRHPRSESLARQMQNGEWKLNGQGLQFYSDGLLADGQHRTGACALSGVTVPICVFYGMERDAIVTIDCGTKRNAADAMMLDGVDNAKLIEQIVKTANAYELKAKVDNIKRLESNAEVLAACTADQSRVVRSINIGEVSVKGISNPTLTPVEAAKVAYIFIKNGWNEEQTAQRLAFFQAGQDENESSPMFQVASTINKAKAKKNNVDRLAAMSQIGLIVKAFQLTEQGVKAVQRKVLNDIQMGKEIPNPKHD